MRIFALAQVRLGDPLYELALGMRGTQVVPPEVFARFRAEYCVFEPFEAPKEHG